MNRHTDELMERLNVKPADIHLPAGGVAVFGRTGTGKSSLFYNSRFVKTLIVADTGSLAHKLFSLGREPVVIDPTKKDSPIQQVRAEVERCMRAGELFLLDSWSTLQESMVAWWKHGSANQRGPAVSLKDHQTIVGHFRDLALVLAQAPGFTVFNTAPGGRGKTPDGQEVVYPAGCITGYPALNGTNANSETVLARWGCVWGVFQGFGDTPRGLYVPGKDFRPESHGMYSPLKDPYMIVRETAGGDRAVMAVPDMRDPANAGRCFADELLIEISAKFRRKAPAGTPPGAQAPAPTSPPAAMPDPLDKGGPAPAANQVGKHLAEEVLDLAHKLELTWNAVRGEYAGQLGLTGAPVFEQPAAAMTSLRDILKARVEEKAKRSRKKGEPAAAGGEG